MKSDRKLSGEFSTPTQLPSDMKRSDWQDRNRLWWEHNPMRYDWNERVVAPEFSREFYEEIDRRFFGDAARYMPAELRPFDEILPYARLPEWDVLEIGVGNGSHTQLIAPHCRTYTGIDITNYAVTSTRKRLELFGLKGDIRQMDAEQLKFPDASFDFIWSWGVIHHSANTGNILAEMYRVLRPGGCATVMVYHRSFLYYYVFSGFFRGVLGGALFRTHSLHELVQLHTDGAIARFYRRAEWRALVRGKGFIVESERVKGQKSEILPVPAGRLKNFLIKAIPDVAARLLLNTCRQGSFLIATLRKP